MNRVLVLGGMHGNESLGIGLVRSLVKYPLKGVDTMMANPRAVAAGARFTESDLNRSFGTGFKGTYETRRAAYIKKMASNYDVVLDFHNTMTTNNNASFIGSAATQQLIETSGVLGLKNCVVATYDCINKFCPNALSIEISLNDPLDNIAYWRDMLADFASNNKQTQPTKVAVYQYLRRVTWAEAECLAVAAWRPFQAIAVSDCKKLEIGQAAYPIFIGSRLTEYYATLLIKKELDNEI